MSPATVSAADATQRLGSFHTLIDARSPAEYAEDHLPGAVNWPVLDNDERREVGTEYAQVSAFDARKRGAAMVAKRVGELLHRHCGPLYLKSMQHNQAGVADAPALPLRDGGTAALREAATTVRDFESLAAGSRLR